MLENLEDSRKAEDQTPKAAEAKNAVAETPPRAFLSLKELQQQIIPVSRRTIFAWRRAGWLPAIETGGRLWFHGPSVVAALRRRQTGGA
jgi:hypothetical protein